MFFELTLVEQLLIMAIAFPIVTGFGILIIECHIKNLN